MTYSVEATVFYGTYSIFPTYMYWEVDASDEDEAKNKSRREIKPLFPDGTHNLTQVIFRVEREIK